MQPADFIRRFSHAVIVSTIGTGLFPSVKMAQAGLETGWGNYTIPSARNLFGIKAAGQKSPYWKGDAISSPTVENINGERIPIVAPFRAYSSYTAGVKDHSYFLVTLPRYAAVISAATPEEQARALEAAGYATDPDYSEKLIKIINDNDLKKLDARKKQIIVTRTIAAVIAIAAIVYIFYQIFKNR